VRAFPPMEHMKETEAVMRTAVTGMRMIAEKYPEYVKLEEAK